MLDECLLLNREAHKTVEQGSARSNINDLGEPSKPENSENSSNLTDIAVDPCTSQTTIVQIEGTTHENYNYETHFGGNDDRKKKGASIIQVRALSDLPSILEIDEDCEDEV